MAARKLASAKRSQAKKRKRLRGLSRKGAQGLFSSTSLVIQPAGREKMSQVLEEFVKPYMDDFRTRDDFAYLLTLGVAAWNAWLLPENSRKEAMDEVFRERRVSKEDRTVQLSLLDELIDRKIAQFATNKRCIVGFELIDTAEGFNLFVISTDLEPPAGRGSTSNGSTNLSG